MKNMVVIFLGEGTGYCRKMCSVQHLILLMITSLRVFRKLNILNVVCRTASAVLDKRFGMYESRS